jgi:stage V sporulation protein D (sporulation-specific penicillin-binding protein)
MAIANNINNGRNTPNLPKRVNSLTRIRVVYLALTIIGAIFILRLFDLQVIKHSYYQQAAYSDQLKQYQIPAQRGMIEANQGSQVVPLVLDQTLYTVFADPLFIKHPDKVADAVQKIIGGNADTYANQMATPDTQYVVIANQLTQSQANQINNLNYPGLGTRGEEYRTYPDGSLASQLLGFVNGNGQGQYGIEEALNGILSGKNGEVKAITDAQGIPLLGNKSNVLVAPKNGNNVVLTINLGIQQQVEQILPTDLKKVNSTSGSVIVMNPSTGNIVAMANYPTYNPSDYADAASPSVYQNAAADTALEPGSVMKTLTVSAAINAGAVSGPNQIFDDPGSWVIDGSTITDIAQDGGVDKGNISVDSVLVNSLNTGATWLLMQMGGGQINYQARNTWYNYMVDHFHLGSPTGIQQGYEASGYVPSPAAGPANNLTYAETSFGQGVTLTPLQLAAADSAILNGGTYYVPNLVQSVINPTTGVQTNTKPKIWKTNIVSQKTSQDLQQIMESVVSTNYYFYQVTLPGPNYIIGGKTGTAQIASPQGGYYANLYNGTFIGFVGTKASNVPEYVIMVEVNEPNIPENSIDTYAGAGAAAPLFGSVEAMLVNDGYVTN